MRPLQDDLEDPLYLCEPRILIMLEQYIKIIANIDQALIGAKHCSKQLLALSFLIHKTL